MKRTLMAVWTCLALSSCALAGPPTDAEIEAALAQTDAKPVAGIPARPRVEAAREAFANISLREASVAQIEKMSRARVLILLPTQWDESKVRLAEIAKEETIEGVRAAEMLLGVTSRPRTASPADLEGHPGLMSDLTIAGLRHPKLKEALAAGHGTAILMSLPRVTPAEFKSEALTTTLEGLMALTLPARPALSLASVFDTLADPSVGVDPAIAGRFRERAKDLLARSIALGEADVRAADEAMKTLPPPEGAQPAGPAVRPPNQPRDAHESAYATVKRVRDETATMIAFMKRAEAYLGGAFARGELIGKPAPDMTFAWKSDPAPWKSLADLKGRIVVLSFWTTQCGTCMGQFPEYRALGEHYKDSPVTVLGVTSRQGYHFAYGPEGASPERLDTSADAAKEHALMSEFVTQQNITWPIVFSDQDVFNPDFGIRSFPCVVIIDAEGVVRAHGTDLAQEPERIREVIDTLLKAAGAGVPVDAAPTPATPPPVASPSGG